MLILNSYTICIQASMVDHDYRLPPELKNILQSVRVFGNFEQPVFLELCLSFSFFDKLFYSTCPP